jgi:hypothetical protein
MILKLGRTHHPSRGYQTFFRRAETSQNINGFLEPVEEEREMSLV